MNNFIEAPLAVLAGVLTIASPCVLPIVPIVLGTSLVKSNPARPLFIVAGFTLTFAAVGMLLSSISQTAVAAHESLRLAANVLLLVTGLAMIWRHPYEKFVSFLSGRMAGLNLAGSTGKSNTGGFLLGMSLGAVWTPCAGPVLASILVLVAKSQNPGWSALLLTLYAVGAGIPMLAIAYGGQYMTRHVRMLSHYTQRFQQVFGVLIVLTAVAIHFQYDLVFYAWITDFFPSLKGL